jgi:hypothetical protein
VRRSEHQLSWTHENTRPQSSVTATKRRIEAALNEDENGKQNVDRNLHVWMKCVEKSSTQRKRDVHTAINILRPLARVLVEKNEPGIAHAGDQIDIKKQSEAKPTKSDIPNG